jgi:hypothetical protein
MCTKRVVDNFVPGHTMKEHVGVAVYLHVFLISTLDGDEWSLLRSGRFVPREVALSIHRMEGWVFQQLIWALCGRQKFLAIVGNQRPIRLSTLPQPSHYTGYANQNYCGKQNFVLAFRSSAWNYSTPSGRIFMNFYI